MLATKEFVIQITEALKANWKLALSTSGAGIFVPFLYVPAKGARNALKEGKEREFCEWLAYFWAPGLVEYMDDDETA